MELNGWLVLVVLLRSSMHFHYLSFYLAFLALIELYDLQVFLVVPHSIATYLWIDVSSFI